MRCPSCDHEASQAAFGDPLRCPDCGAFYEKAVSLKLAKLERELVAARLARPQAPTAAPAPVLPTKKRTPWWVWFVAGLFVIGVFNVILNAPPPSSTAEVEPKPKPPQPAAVAPVAPRVESPPARDAVDSVRLEYKWGKKHDTLMVANFTVINDGPIAVKDIEIECVHSGASGTRVDSNTRTIYDVVPGRGRKQFNGFDMGFIHSQAVTSRCSVISVKT